MPQLTSSQALQLTSIFACIADRLRASGADLQERAQLYETASRVAFLRAHLLAKREEIRPVFGETYRRAVFVTA